ncbi:MAG TPA: MarR family transcriptional regulator [Fimbriimonadaceae bacterium]
MQHEKEDIIGMVAPLMAIVSGIDRKRKQGDAALLSVLQIVAMKGTARPLDIAKELGVHQSTITRHIQSLEQLGKVTVVGDETDRRSCKVALSSKGAEELQRLTEIGISRFEKMVEEWSREEVQTLGRLLTKLQASRTAMAEKEKEEVRESWKTRRDRE